MTFADVTVWSFLCRCQSRPRWFGRAGRRECCTQQAMENAFTSTRSSLTGSYARRLFCGRVPARVAGRWNSRETSTRRHAASFVRKTDVKFLWAETVHVLSKESVVCGGCTTIAEVLDLPDRWDNLALNYLTSLGFSDGEVFRIVDRAPELLAEPVDTKLQPLIEYLLERVGSMEGVRKLVLRHPRVLRYNLDAKVRPAVGFLYDLGLNSDDVREVLLRFPNVLGYGVKSDLNAQLAYLISLGIPQSQVADLVRARPQVLGVYIDPVVRYLQAIGVQRRDIGKMLSSFPIDYSIPVRAQAEDEGRTYDSDDLN